MAIRVGLGVCVGSAAIILADDGQDNPNVIPEMIQKWGGGKDIVWALHAKRVDTFLIKIMSQEIKVDLHFHPNLNGFLSSDRSKAMRILLNCLEKKD